MTKEKVENCCTPKKGGMAHGGAGVYCLGAIGAAVYFIQNAETFWWGVLGVLKASVWPALLVYRLFELAS